MIVDDFINKLDAIASVFKSLNNEQRQAIENRVNHKHFLEPIKQYSDLARDVQYQVKGKES